MNQSRPQHNLLYRRFSEAAQILLNELIVLGNYSSLNEEEEKEEEKKNEDGEDDSQREILFLRCILEYFYANRVYAYSSDSAMEGFCIKFGVTQNDFATQLCKYKKRYVNRVIKICKNLQPLDQPHDQDAFDLGNRVWGCRKYEMLSEVEDHENDNNVNLDENGSMSPGEEDEDDEWVSVLEEDVRVRKPGREDSGEEVEESADSA